MKGGAGAQIDGGVPVIVHPYACFEALLAGVGSPVRWDAPVRQPVVVPSLAFADALQRGMADRFGVSMGLEWLTPQEFIHRAVGPGEGSPWSKRRLVWRILPHVGGFAPQLGVEDPSPRDRFALAGVLADRLDQYGHYRPEMILGWAAGRGARGGHEAWQRDLWRRLRRETEHPHPAEALAQLQNDPVARRAFMERYPKLLVIATGTMDPLLVALLGLLGEAGAEVSVHVLLPSLGYLGDLRRRGRLPPEDADPEEFCAGAGHPMLESMGRNAAGAFVLLGRLDEQYTHWPEADEADDAGRGASVLSRLQNDIRALRLPSADDGVAESADASVRVHACFGPRREMEVLRDELLRAFDELPDLKPDEVRIVTPDLETYAPLVPAVFGSGEGALPVRLTERTTESGDTVGDALAAVFDMAVSGRFEAAEVLALVQKTPVLAALGTEDAEGARTLVRESGLTHGIDSGGGREGFGPRPGTSAFARDRLVAGRWFGAESTAVYPDGEYVLPAGDALGGDPAFDLRFHDWLLTLERTVAEWGSAAVAAVWGDRLEAACRVLFSGDEDTLLSMRRQIVFLRELDCSEPMDAGSVADWLASERDEARRRGDVSGRIAFGRMKPLQNLPCRVLAVAGMHAAFPAQNRAPVWDLLRSQPCVWDRNPRVDDRQLFLDAVLTPKERLIVTAPNRNPRTGKNEPFSACVDELLRTCALMGRRSLVVDHRLQPFVGDYFRTGSDFPRSYDRLHAALAAKIHRKDAREAPPFWRDGDGPEFSLPALPDPEAGSTVVRAEHLAGFWKDPAAGFLRALGVTLPREEPDDETFNRPPLALDALGDWVMRDRILHAKIEQRLPPEFIAQQLRAERGLPPDRLGETVWTAGRQTAEPLADAVLNAAGEEAEFEYSLSERISVAATVRWTRDRESLLVYRAGEWKKPGHRLEPWIGALVAAACGEPMPVRLYAEGQTGAPDVAAPVSPEEARARLDLLVRGYFAGQSRPLRFAPATSDAIAGKLGGSDPATAVTAGEGEWNRPDLGRGGGEGSDAAARRAWRGVNPFGNQEEWLYWAEHVALPLRQWGGQR